MAQVLLLLSLSFGAVILLGCALVVIDDRLEGATGRNGVAAVERSAVRRLRARLARPSGVSGRNTPLTRELAYEPYLFPQSSPSSRHTSRPSAR